MENEGQARNKNTSTVRNDNNAPDFTAIAMSGA